MTPKEKATELFEKMLSTDKVDNYSFVSNNVAKQCALICVDEIIKEVTPKVSIYTYKLQYWQEVKQNIENL
jgi:hypothetical protein